MAYYYTSPVATYKSNLMSFTIIESVVLYMYRDSADTQYHRVGRLL